VVQRRVQQGTVIEFFFFFFFGEKYKAGLGIPLYLCAKSKKLSIYIASTPLNYAGCIMLTSSFHIFAFTYSEAQHPTQP
jgi:hypothetical protein